LRSRPPMATSFAFENRSFAAAAFRLKTGSLDAYGTTHERLNGCHDLRKDQ